MAWVENFLNLTNGYYKVTSSEEDQFEYLVPFPPGYTSTTRAQWITDVIVLNPTCSWQTVTATATGPVIESDWNVTLPESNLGCRLGMNYQLGMFLLSSNVFSCVYSISVSSPVNTTKVSVIMCSNTSAPEFTVPVDGSVLLMIDQLNYPDSQSQIIRTMSVDFSSIPTLELPTGNVLAFLLCSPHVSIQTYPVLATGNGSLTLGPQRQRSQGNINFSQANYLLSYILRDLPNNSGPTSNSSQVGTDLIQRLIFGTDVVDHSYYMPPAPLTNITAVYKQVIHSAVKTVLSGAFGTANVPGGYSEEQMVFTSSLGHVITSVILFAFLTIAGVAAQLRKGQVAFTWANVAAALADSDVLQKSVEMMQVKAGMEERKVLKLVPGGDGRPYCVYESID
jgi:hypothetical protein